MRRALRAGGLEADDLDLKVVAGVTVGDVVGADQGFSGDGRRPLGVFDQVSPGLPFREAMLLGLMGLGEDRGVSGGQLDELLGRLLLQLVSQETVLEHRRLGEQRGELGDELIVGDILQLIPPAPDRILFVDL